MSHDTWGGCMVCPRAESSGECNGDDCDAEFDKWVFSVVAALKALTSKTPCTHAMAEGKHICCAHGGMWPCPQTSARIALGMEGVTE